MNNKQSREILPLRVAAARLRIAGLMNDELNDKTRALKDYLVAKRAVRESSMVAGSATDERVDRLRRQAFLRKRARKVHIQTSRASLREAMKACAV